jgi:hypothetical protein
MVRRKVRGDSDVTYEDAEATEVAYQRTQWAGETIGVRLDTYPLPVPRTAGETGHNERQRLKPERQLQFPGWWYEGVKQRP